MWEFSQLKIIRVVGNLCPMQVILGSLFPFPFCFFVFVFETSAGPAVFIPQIGLGVIIRSLC